MRGIRARARVLSQNPRRIPTTRLELMTARQAQVSSRRLNQLIFTQLRTVRTRKVELKRPLRTQYKMTRMEVKAKTKTFPHVVGVKVAFPSLSGIAFSAKVGLKDDIFT